MTRQELRAELISLLREYRGDLDARIADTPDRGLAASEGRLRDRVDRALRHLGAPAVQFNAAPF